MALGYTVDELLRRISAKELTEWMAYDTLEPFSAERADYRAGVIASVVANAHRDTKKRKKPFQPKDFMPEFDRERSKPKQQSWQDMMAIMKGLS